MRGTLDADQIDTLLKPIRAHRVYESQGNNHVAQHDIRAHLSRIFGFDGWDKEILSLELVRERLGHDTKEDKKNWYVTYRCVMRLSIYDRNGNTVKVVEDVATGSAENQPSYGDAHDLASKNAVSYALKRCATDLGDQFGLSLYEKGGATDRDGNYKPFVKNILGHTHGSSTEIDDHVTITGETDSFDPATTPFARLPHVCNENTLSAYEKAAIQAGVQDPYQPESDAQAAVLRGLLANLETEAA